MINMIYITNKNVQNTVQIPCNLSKSTSNSYKLVLKNTSSRKEYSFDVEDANLYSKYYTISVNLEGLDYGEYEYSLVSNSNFATVSLGIFRLLAEADRIEIDTTVTYSTHNEDTEFYTADANVEYDTHNEDVDLYTAESDIEYETEETLETGYTRTITIN